MKRFVDRILRFWIKKSIANDIKSVEEHSALVKELNQMFEGFKRKIANGE